MQSRTDVDTDEIELIERLTLRDVKSLKYAIDLPERLFEKWTDPVDLVLNVNLWQEFNPDEFLEALGLVRPDLISYATRIPYLNTPSLLCRDITTSGMNTFVSMLRDHISTLHWKIILKEYNYNVENGFDISEILSFCVRRRIVTKDLEMLNYSLRKVKRLDLADKLNGFQKKFSKMDDSQFLELFKKEAKCLIEGTSSKVNLDGHEMFESQATQDQLKRVAIFSVITDRLHRSNGMNDDMERNAKRKENENGDPINQDLIKQTSDSSTSTDTVDSYSHDNTAVSEIDQVNLLKLKKLKRDQNPEVLSTNPNLLSDERSANDVSRQAKSCGTNLTELIKNLTPKYVKTIQATNILSVLTEDRTPSNFILNIKEWKSYKPEMFFQTLSGVRNDLVNPARKILHLNAATFSIEPGGIDHIMRRCSMENFMNKIAIDRWRSLLANHEYAIEKNLDHSYILRFGIRNQIIEKYLENLNICFEEMRRNDMTERMEFCKYLRLSVSKLKNKNIEAFKKKEENYNTLCGSSWASSDCQYLSRAVISRINYGLAERTLSYMESALK